MPRSRHARPRPPVVPLVLGTLTGVALVVILVVALSRVAGSTQTASEGSGVPQTTPATTEALGASESCERAVTQALARYARVRVQGGDTALALGSEQARLSPLEYTAFSSVVNEVDMALASGQQGLGNIISSVMPAVRQRCAQG